MQRCCNNIGGLQRAMLCYSYRFQRYDVLVEYIPFIQPTQSPYIIFRVMKPALTPGCRL